MYHTTVVCSSHRIHDLFRRRYWVMCRLNDHEGPFVTRDEACEAQAKHRHTQATRKVAS